MSKPDFDKLVEDYNTWLDMPRGWKWWARDFFRGMLWLGPDPHPINDRTDLTAGQKNAVSIASDFERVRGDVENIRSTLDKQEYDSMLSSLDHMYALNKKWFYGTN